MSPGALYIYLKLCDLIIGNPGIRINAMMFSFFLQTSLRIPWVRMGRVDVGKKEFLAPFPYLSPFNRPGDHPGHETWRLERNRGPRGRWSLSLYLPEVTTHKGRWWVFGIVERFWRE